MHEADDVRAASDSAPGENERFVPANGVNPEWVTYYTVHLHDNSMPPRAELPLADVLAAVEEYVRTGRRPMCVDWTPEAA